MSQELHSAAYAVVPATDRPCRPLEGTIYWPGVWVALLAVAATAASLGQVASRSQGGLFVLSLSFVVLLLAAGFDAGTGRIPNALTYVAIALGLLLNAVAALFQHLGSQVAFRWLGAPGMEQSLAGFGVCAILGVVCLLMMGLGGGDLKLLTALGALLGLQQVGTMMVYALALAMAYAVLNLLLAGHVNGFFRGLALNLLKIMWLGQPAEFEHGKRAIPLAVPLLLGLPLARLWPLQQWL